MVVSGVRRSWEMARQGPAGPPGPPSTFLFGRTHQAALVHDGQHQVFLRPAMANGQQSHEYRQYRHWAGRVLVVAAKRACCSLPRRPLPSRARRGKNRAARVPDTTPNTGIRRQHSCRAGECNLHGRPRAAFGVRARGRPCCNFRSCAAVLRIFTRLTCRSPTFGAKRGWLSTAMDVLIPAAGRRGEKNAPLPWTARRRPPAREVRWHRYCGYLRARQAKPAAWKFWPTPWTASTATLVRFPPWTMAGRAVRYEKLSFPGPDAPIVLPTSRV